MFIKSLSYQNLSEGWGFEKIEFSNLTLLVGISGVGKTQILKALMDLKEITLGKSLNGVKWELEFSISRNEYFWQGEFEFLETYNDDYLEDEDKLPIILSEQFYENATLFFERIDKNTYFKHVKLPKLSPEKSLVDIFKEEIKEVYKGFKLITLRDQTQNLKRLAPEYWDDRYLEIYDTYEAIKNSDLDIVCKLICLYEHENDKFQLIVENFKEVFPNVEDLMIDIDENFFALFRSSQIIYLKEKDVDNWIPQNHISSGMLRTFIHISEMFLLKKGSVVLIDEFENSLGVNCINTLIEDLIYENQDIQFIATSHHPYIINKIPYEYWKIVTRKGGQISTTDATEFNLGESHHERFLNLINLREYRTGQKRAS